jgi:hypothetical protein
MTVLLPFFSLWGSSHTTLSFIHSFIQHICNESFKIPPLCLLLEPPGGHPATAHSLMGAPDKKAHCLSILTDTTGGGCSNSTGDTIVGSINMPRDRRQKDLGRRSHLSRPGVVPIAGYHGSNREM